MERLFIFSLFFTIAAAYSVCPQHVECIPGCVKIDERGCKCCACGPMMFHPGGGCHGMPGLLGGSSFTPGTLGGGAVAEKPLKECSGTMLCMMTCRGSFSLSKDVQSNGCRTCTCPKPQTTKPQQQVQPAIPKPAHSDCTGTKLCMLTCKGKYILGELGTDGCKSCACIPEPESTPKPLFLTSVGEQECHEMILCMLSCKHGHTLAPKCNDNCHDKCQKCTCLEPTPPPQQLFIVPQAPKKECPHTLECMLSCKDGYSIGSTGADGCPTCSCLAPTKAPIIVYQVQCPQALSCSRGCSVGYKCSSDGCPTCECIHPQVVGLVTVTQIYTETEVTCKSALTCPKSCSLGYKCGDDGCPICECCVEVQTVTNVRPLVAQPTQPPVVTDMVHKCPATIQCMASCKTGYTVGTEDRNGCPTCTCINKQTTECHDICDNKPAVAVHLCDATIHCMATCTDGYEFGANTQNGCPVCTCKQKTCETGCEETQHAIQLATSSCTSNCETECTGDCGSSGGTALQVVSGGFSSSGASTGGGGGAFGGGGSAMSAGGGSGGGMTGGGNQCPPMPHNCQPYCIKYDEAHCRLCQCENAGTNGFSG